MNASSIKRCPGNLDVIGDIHGDADRLERLLRILGYAPGNGTWSHPDGRRAVFLGDLVDRGPKVRETLALVKSMVDAGTALMVLGNHEFNLLCLETPDGNGGFLRERNERNLNTSRATLDAFEGAEDKLRDYLEWFRTLPLYLDLGSCRFIHAEWNPGMVARVYGRGYLDDEYLRRATTKGTGEYDTIEVLLKGSEVPLPAGVTFRDHDGTERDHVRVRWTSPAAGRSYRELALPAGPSIPDVPVPAGAAERLTGYDSDAPPVFFGHYALSEWRHGIIAPNAACLDHGCGKGGRLVAYRWDGEATLSVEKLVSTED